MNASKQPTHPILFTPLWRPSAAEVVAAEMLKKPNEGCNYLQRLATTSCKDSQLPVAKVRRCLCQKSGNRN